MRRSEAATRFLLAPTLGLGMFAVGCGFETADDPETAQIEVTHAVVVIERSAEADELDAVKAEAFAGFLNFSAELEPSAVLPIAGLSLDLPAIDACKNLDDDPTATAPEGLVRAELLDAGEVTLAAGGVVTTLAPRAFPNAADGISGVVYTTRDRAAEPLPAASRYTVATSGSAALDPISVELPAPAALSAVTLMGTPLSDGATVPVARALDLRWNAGAQGDIVYATLETDDTSTLCAFRDDSGRGTLPATALPRAGSASLTVHRLRAMPFSSVGLVGRGELRFDFEISGSVTVE